MVNHNLVPRVFHLSDMGQAQVTNNAALPLSDIRKERCPGYEVSFLKKKKNFMAPFYGWGSTASRLEPLRGGSLLFTTKFPEVPGTHFIDLGRMKG